MNDHTADASPASGGRALLWAAAPVVAVSAAFTFLLQPVVGKFLVPQVGGGAGLWVTTMCFFQTALFLGYGGAYLVRRWPLARQAGAVALLGVVAALTFRLPPDLAHVAEGWTGITLSLARALLPSVVLSTALGIVLQGWLAAVQGRVPFWLYGVSNAGSLLALLAYPFLIEPVIDLGAQAGVLRTILWVLVTAAGVAGVVIARKHARRRVPEEGVESIPPARWCGWIAASFLSCAWLIAATNLLQAEIGSSPLAWVIPFALYLIGFSLGFVASWPAWLRGAIAALVIVGHFGFVATRGVSHVGLLGSAAIWLLFVLFAGCLFIHREIYLARPARRYSQFYLAIAAGGMLAGIVCSLVLPNVLARPLELVACGTVASTWAVFVLATRAPRALRGAAAGLLVAASAVLVAYQLRAEDAGGVRVRTLRNHYGTVVLRVSRDRLTLASESTLHGMQYFAPELQRTPTAYYHEATAFGRAVRELQRTAPQLRYGAVGLGVGTAAAYLRPGDSCIFWEINPLMVQVAADAFSYLRGSAGKVAVELIDGRLGVERAKDPFDVLLLDAFSGDGVPAHLLTREAFRLYQAKTPRGVIFCHISNHHMDLFPVIAGHARAPSTARRRRRVPRRQSRRCRRAMRSCSRPSGWRKSRDGSAAADRTGPHIIAFPRTTWRRSTGLTAGTRSSMCCTGRDIPLARGSSSSFSGQLLVKTPKLRYGRWRLQRPGRTLRRRNSLWKTSHIIMKSYRRTKGFTLVEIMIVVTIIGLLAAIAIPAFARVRRESQNRAILNNLRQISYAAHQYFMETGAPSVVLTDLVGNAPDKSIRVLTPAADENYNTLFPVLYDFTALSITKSDGTTITYSR